MKNYYVAPSFRLLKVSTEGIIAASGEGYISVDLAPQDDISDLESEENLED